MKYLPSPYIKFWWCDISLDIRDPTTTLLILFASISLSIKVLNAIQKERQKRKVDK